MNRALVTVVNSTLLVPAGTRFVCAWWKGIAAKSFTERRGPPARMRCARSLLTSFILLWLFVVSGTLFVYLNAQKQLLLGSGCGAGEESRRGVEKRRDRILTGAQGRTRAHHSVFESVEAQGKRWRACVRACLHGLSADDTLGCRSQGSDRVQLRRKANRCSLVRKA